MNKSFITAVVCLLLSAGCSEDPPVNEPDEADDPCEADGRYLDGVCNRECPRPDSAYTAAGGDGDGDGDGGDGDGGDGDGGDGDGDGGDGDGDGDADAPTEGLLSVPHIMDLTVAQDPIGFTVLDAWGPLGGSLLLRRLLEDARPRSAAVPQRGLVQFLSRL